MLRHAATKRDSSPARATAVGAQARRNTLSPTIREAPRPRFLLTGIPDNKSTI